MENEKIIIVPNFTCKCGEIITKENMIRCEECHVHFFHSHACKQAARFMHMEECSRFKLLYGLISNMLSVFADKGKIKQYYIDHISKNKDSRILYLIIDVHKNDAKLNILNNIDESMCIDFQVNYGCFKNMLKQQSETTIPILVKICNIAFLMQV